MIDAEYECARLLRQRGQYGHDALANRCVVVVTGGISSGGNDGVDEDQHELDTETPLDLLACLFGHARKLIECVGRRQRRAFRAPPPKTIDLYSRVKMGALVVVLGPKQGDARVASVGSSSS